MCPEGAQLELLCERCVPKVLKLSCEVSECKPLVHGNLLGSLPDGIGECGRLRNLMLAGNRLRQGRPDIACHVHIMP
jgi:hypothetical protein